MNRIILETLAGEENAIGTKPIFFLQSPEWEEFQRKLGRKTWRVGRTLLIQHLLPRGFHYLYSPRPTLSIEETPLFLSQTKEIAEKEHSLFLKIDPAEAIVLPPEVVPRETRPSQPRSTVVVDLTRSEREILSSLHSKTRYNIRVAERAQVSISTEGSFSEFWNLLQETAVRDGFSLHPKAHYEKLLETRTPQFSNELFFARLGIKAIAAVLINFYAPSGQAVYLHGASSRESRNVMAPHLLHWHVMQEAKRRGYGMYDLWGIDERAWPGLTRFKKSFGGRVVDYPPSYEIVYRPFWYRVYNIKKAAKRLFKGF